MTITGSGFKAKEALAVFECKVTGLQASASTCNLADAALASTSSSGTFTEKFEVHITFGTTTCSSTTPCQISVSEASETPTDFASEPISFA